jgi:hypothetical protein
MRRGTAVQFETADHFNLGRPSSTGR